MSDLQSGPTTSRCLAELRGRDPGPTLVVVLGLHGNEAESIDAAKLVAEELVREPPLRGQVVFVRGNHRALEERRRYLDRDLNRLWTEAHVRRLRDGLRSAGDAHEDLEQLELLGVFDRCLRPGSGLGRVLLDLHCYSGQGRPFAIGTAKPENVDFVSALGLPLVLGLQESLGGTLSDYYDHQVDVSLAVEGGRIDDPDTVRAHRVILERSMTALGIVEPTRFGSSQMSAGAKARVFRISYRHPVRPEDGFQMYEGFASFQLVQRGAALARDRDGEVTAPHDGVLLMPLYQPVGEDGFFLAREVDLELS